MLLIFKRFSEYLTFNIDRKKKTLQVNGEQTNYKEQEMSWRMLWDKCEEHKRKPNEDNSKCKACNEVIEKQDKDTESLSNKKFVKIFEDQMKVYGFELVKWEL